LKKAFRLGLVTVVALLASLTLGSVALADETSPYDTIKLEYDTETITGLTTGLEYSVDAKTWKDVWGETLDISGLISTTKATNVYFFDKSLDPKANTTDSHTVTIPQRGTTDKSAASYNGITEEITVPANYQYMTGIFDWADVESTAIKTDHATLAADISVRLKATGSAFATAPATVKVPARPAAPTTPAYDVATDSIKGLASDKMQVVVGAATGLGETPDWKDAGKVTTLSRAGLDTIFAGNTFVTGADPIYLFVRTAATEKAPASFATAAIIFPKKATATTASDYEIDYAVETLTVTDGADAYEYSKDNGKTYTAIKGDTLTLTSLIPAAGKQSLTIQLRAKAQPKEIPAVPASEPVPVEILARPKTPAKTDVSYDMESEKLKLVGVELDTIVYNKGAGYGTDDENAVTAEGVALPAGDKAVTVKFKVPAHTAEEEGDQPSNFASAEFSLTVPAQPAAPKPVYNAASDAITGVSKLLEWAQWDEDAYGDWTPFSNITTAPRSEFTGEGVDLEKTIFIRAKATPTAPASKVAEVEFPEEIDAVEGIGVDYATETLTGLEEGKTYKDYEYTKYAKNTDDDPPAKATWTALPSNLSVKTLIPAPKADAIRIGVRLKATKTDPASAPQPVDIKARAATPDKTYVEFNGEENAIIVKTEVEGLQYLAPKGEYAAVEVEEGEESAPIVYKSIPVTPDTAAQAYKFRVAAEGAPISAEFTVTVPARAAMPSTPAYSAATDTITGVTEKMEWNTEDAEQDDPWTAIEKGVKTLDRATFGLADDGGTLYIRTAATPTAPASKVKAIPVAKATPAPTAYEIDKDAETMTVTGASSIPEALEYSANDGKTWTAFKNGGSITSLISTKAATPILVRVKATSSTPASATLPVTIFQRALALTAKEIKYVYAPLEGFVQIGTGPELSKLEYAVGTDTTYTAMETGIGKVTPGAAAQSVKVRIAKTETTFASLPFTITVAKRANAPAVSWNTTSLQITGTKTTMQWKIKGEADITYSNITTSTVLNQAFFGYYNEPKIVEIRVTATDTVPASQAKEVTVPANPELESSEPE
jgi:hypothetical protein